MFFPAITASIACISLITYVIPGLSDFFVFDRELIISGELWRLATALFVHFSMSHLGWNLLIFVAAGCLIESQHFRNFSLICILSALVPGLLYLIAAPELHRYGGISALATAAVAYLCLEQAHRKTKDKWLWIALLTILILKIPVELVIEQSIFARQDAMPFQVLPSAHAAGLVVALIVFRYEAGNKPG